MRRTARQVMQNELKPLEIDYSGTQCLLVQRQSELVPSSKAAVSVVVPDNGNG